MEQKTNNSEKSYKTIGLILEDAFTDYAKDIAHSVSHTIMNMKDMRLIVVAGRQDNCTDPEDKMHRFKQLYNTIYSMHSKCPFDGLLFTFPNLIGVNENLFKDIPKVYIASDKDHKPAVNYDNEMGVREALDYLIRIKGLTKFCMLGGRDDNADAQARKNAYSRYLIDEGLEFTEAQYEKTDMSVNSYDAAARLLARNPDAQVVFCCNDSVAVGLYDVMRERGLIPGKDMIVFGFDNADMTGQMMPPLASIGASGITVGQRALELLLDMINGQEVSSVVVPTRLFGRESFEYETYKITSRDLLSVDSAYIYGFFDDCFYRYNNEVVDPSAIDLRRLFFEIISRMMAGLRNRYMDEKEIASISRLIDIFFANNAMRYTDANKFVRSLSGLQGSMNEIFKGIPTAAYNNRLIAYMKDKAIQSQALAMVMQNKSFSEGREKNFEFMINTINYGRPGDVGIENVIDNFDRFGFDNAALFLFDEPVECIAGQTDKMPDNIYLRCVVKEKNLYMISEDRRECRLSEIYSKTEIPYDRKGFISFPLFYGNYVFGMLVSHLSRALMDNGDYNSFILGRALYMNWILSKANG